MTTVGSLVYQFFEHHLKADRGLSQASIRSYRDGIRLLLLFMAKRAGHPISKLALSDLSADNVRSELSSPILKSNAATISDRETIDWRCCIPSSGSLEAK